MADKRHTVVLLVYPSTFLESRGMCSTTVNLLPQTLVDRNGVNGLSDHEKLRKTLFVWLAASALCPIHRCLAIGLDLSVLNFDQILDRRRASTFHRVLLGQPRRGL